MTALQLIKNQTQKARETFEGTVADLTPDMLHVEPGGKALPLGAQYAHLIFLEDAIIQGMLQGKAPLYQSTYTDKTGASEPIPVMDEQWSENNQKWSHSVQIDLNKFRAYSKDVYETTDVYINSLTDSDLEKEIDLGSWGKKQLAEILTEFIVGHTYSLAGEISVLKGLQGAKGYQF